MTDPDLQKPTHPAATSRPWWRRLLGHAWHHRRTVLLALGATVLAMAAATSIPLIERVIIDQVAAGTLSLGPVVVLLLSVGLVRFGAGAARRYFGGRLSLDVQHDLRTEIFVALSRLDGARQDALQTSQVVSRSISDLTMVQGLVAMVPTLVSSALLFVLALVVMLALSPTLTLVTLVVVPLLAVTAARSNRRLYPATWAAQQHDAALTGVVDETVTGVRVVKGFGQEGRELRRLGAAAGELFTARMRVINLSSLYGSTLQALPLVGQVAILGFGGWMASRGEISLGTFAAFATYLAEMIVPMQGLAALLTGIQQARASAERVFEVIDSRPLVTEKPGAHMLAPHATLLELEDVTFGYAADQPVLRGLSFTVRPGETLAVVGTAGAGKSTVAMLLARFYDVQGGAVRIGGQDVREVKLDSLRSALGLVMEESFLFSGTIRSNIAFGRQDATEEQIVAAAVAAGADRFIRELPHGYDTAVGEKGFTLSGGQRQRISLARTLITDPPVLVLDDATSAVDPRTEAEIHLTLRQITAGRTTLLIARRHATLQLADRILVLDNGRAADCGSHDELVERCALYRSIFAEPEQHPQPDQDPAGRELPGPTAGWAADGVAATLRGPRAAADERPGPSSTDAAAVSSQLAGLAALSGPDELATGSSIGLRQLLRPFRAVLVLGMVLVLLEALAGTSVPLLIRQGIDDGIRRSEAGGALAAAGIATAIALAGWAVSIWQIRTNGRTGERLRLSLRLKAFAHLQRLDLEYYENEHSGRIMTRLTADVEAVAGFTQSGFATAAVSVLSTVGILGVLVVLNCQLGLVVSAALPVLLAATAVFRAKSSRAYVEARDKVGLVNADLQENVAGLRVAQAFGRTRYNTERFARASNGYRASRVRAQRYLAVYFGFVEFLPEVTALCVLAIGVGQVRTGALTIGVLIAFLLYVDVFFSSVQQLSQVFEGYQQAVVGLRRLAELLSTPTGTPSAAAPRPVRRLRGHISFRQVDFRYRGAESNALTRVNLTIPAGQTVALVGQTGAGKSTLIKLLARFYDVSAGAIHVDGLDLRELDLKGYRRRLGIVPQEAYLSAGTVRDAIAYGRPEATDAEVEAAARAVGAHQVIAQLTGGYLHQVGDRGRNLSAGQCQLIALARAELIDPDVLLLDEATATLDAATEAVVARALRRLSQRRTTLIVAHRLSTAARTDRVLVLHHGRVVEDGPHADLLAANGRYTRLWHAADARSHMG